MKFVSLFCTAKSKHRAQRKQVKSNISLNITCITTVRIKTIITNSSKSRMEEKSTKISHVMLIKYKIRHDRQLFMIVYMKIFNCTPWRN